MESLALARRRLRDGVGDCVLTVTDSDTAPSDL